MHIAGCQNGINMTQNFGKIIGWDSDCFPYQAECWTLLLLVSYIVTMELPSASNKTRGLLRGALLKSCIFHWLSTNEHPLKQQEKTEEFGMVLRHPLLDLQNWQPIITTVETTNIAQFLGNDFLQSGIWDWSYRKYLLYLFVLGGKLFKERHRVLLLSGGGKSKQSTLP